jgi:hypothetical protein
MTAHFGLDERMGTVDLVEVEWPASGIMQRFVDVPVNSTLLAHEQLLGDFNGDRVVDGADYTIWRDSQGLTGSELAADVAGIGGMPDGVVDQLDYDCWKANFGLSYSAPSEVSGIANSVPEPATWAHLATVQAGVSVWLRRRSNRQHRERTRRS